MKSIAVVILNWNGKSLLQKFLPDVIARSSLPGVSVIVADNASTDGSIEWLEANHPNIQRISLEANYGFAGGYNKSLKQIDAEFYLLLNSDVLPAEDWLLPIRDLLETCSSDIAAVMPKIKSYYNPELFEYAGAAGGYIDRFGYPFCRGRLMNIIEHDHGQYDSIKDVFWASGAAFVVNAKLFHQIGGFDEHFFAHMEEIDLCWRLKNLGYRILCVPQSVVYHIGGATLDQSHPRKTYLNFRNNLFILVKNLPTQHFISTLLIRMLLDGVAAMKFLFSFEFQFFFAVWSAHISFYRQLGYYLKLRRKYRSSLPSKPHNEVYQGSFIYEFYINKKQSFKEFRSLLNIG